MLFGRLDTIYFDMGFVNEACTKRVIETKSHFLAQ